MMAEYICTVDSCGEGEATMTLGQEIIRCRDCKHKDDWLDGGGQCGVVPDGFCAWAERDE